jgi:hypothetical protein
LSSQISGFWQAVIPGNDYHPVPGPLRDESLVQVMARAKGSDAISSLLLFGHHGFPTTRYPMRLNDPDAANIRYNTKK